LKEIDKRRGTDVLDINDPKNGLTVSLNIHQAIDSGGVAILNVRTLSL
jgi:HNH endonuclease